MIVGNLRMDILYAPWRSGYVTKEGKPAHNDCVFCSIIALNKDEEQFVAKRYAHCVLMLNRYPYTSGHLLVVPYTHATFLTDLTPEARAEIMEVTTQATIALKKLLNPHAFNIGCNLGKEAGASVPGHLHEHIIPRWGADLGFLELIGHATKINIDLQIFYKNLVAALEE